MQNCERLLFSSCLSLVCLSTCNSLTPTGWIFMKFDIWIFLKNLSEFKFYLSLTRITDNLHEDLCTLMVMSHPGLLRMRSISDKFVEKIRTLIFGSITFIQKLCHLWDNGEEYGGAKQATDDNIIGFMHCAC